MRPPEIFDRGLRRLRRDRAQPAWAAHDVIRRQIVAELLDRLDGVKRRFSRALDLGTADGSLATALRARDIPTIGSDPGFRFAQAAGGVQADEDRLPFADASFDLIVSAGVLDQVNDLPGALLLIRRVLKPDGLFLGGFVGAGSLPLLRAATLQDGEPGAARIHPQIDVRAGGDLLQRAGFALPVADGFDLEIGYADADMLVRDLRGQAMTSLLVDRAPAFSRNGAARLVSGLARAADGRIRERFSIVCLTGWSPSPNQARSASRGSGVTSLASVLQRPRNPF